MATCYHCAVSIRPNEGYRRQVQTGTTTRVYISRRPGSSYGNSYGLRTLCQNCAAVVDQRRAVTNEKTKLASISAIVGLISAAIAFFNVRSFGDDDSSRLVFLFLLLGGPGFCLYFLLLILRNKNTGTATYSQEHQEFDEPVMPMVVPSQPIAPVLQSTHADTPNAPLPAMGEALKKTAYNLHDKGLSLFGIYGLTETTEDLPELLEAIAIATPPRYSKDMDGWQKTIEEQAYRRFFQELTRATEGGEPDLPSLIQIFPAREDEEVMDYLERLNSTGQVLADTLNKGE